MPISQLWKRQKSVKEDLQYSLKDDLKKPPRDYLWVSIITFPCNPIFSIIAIFLSVRSKQEKKLGAWESADQYGRSAIMFAIFGFMLTVFISILVFDLNFERWFPDLYAKIYDPDYYTNLEKLEAEKHNSTLISEE